MDAFHSRRLECRKYLASFQQVVCNSVGLHKIFHARKKHPFSVASSNYFPSRFAYMYIIPVGRFMHAYWTWSQRCFCHRPSEAISIWVCHTCSWKEEKKRLLTEIEQNEEERRIKMTMKNAASQRRGLDKIGNECTKKMYYELWLHNVVPCSFQHFHYPHAASTYSTHCITFRILIPYMYDSNWYATQKNQK